MDVHSTPLDALEKDMQTSTSPETLPVDAGDTAWVVNLFEVFREGDLDAVADQLEHLVRVSRKAGKARRMLATADPVLLREGLALCDSRSGVHR
jgi:hypothetical protein